MVGGHLEAELVLKIPPLISVNALFNFYFLLSRSIFYHL
jgi:hypothetical protein